MPSNYDGNNWMIAWTPEPDRGGPVVKVGPWPDRTGWSREYSCTSGCCYGHFSGLDEEEQAHRLLN